jgi:Na+/H+ antiporter NhaD/arsenite permease-like protein
LPPRQRDFGNRPTAATEAFWNQGGCPTFRSHLCGAVFMGANAISAMARISWSAIAEENGVRMPSFFGYMVYSVCILIPIFVLVTLVFFR